MGDLVDGTATTVDRLRREIDEAIVAAGAFPAGNTSVDVGSTDTTDRRSNEPTAARSDEPTTVRPGEPIVVSVALVARQAITAESSERSSSPARAGGNAALTSPSRKRFARVERC